MNRNVRLNYKKTALYFQLDTNARFICLNSKVIMAWNHSSIFQLTYYKKVEEQREVLHIRLLGANYPDKLN
jgi:hypothetical protein